MADEIRSPSGLFSVELRHVPDAAVVVINGEVDLSNAEELAAALVEADTQSSTRDLTVDLANLRFIDSAGLHVLWRAGRRARRFGRRLSAINTPPHARLLFALTALDSVIDIHP